MEKSKHSNGWAWLFVFPFLALLFPGLYARQSPVVGGFPMFYWYLLLWIVVTAIISAVVYRTDPHDAND